jgi:hypothetical protein
VNHGVLELAGTHAVAETRFFQVVGRHAHVFHAAGHHHIGIAGLDRLGRQHDGLQGGTTHLVDGNAFRFPGHAGLDRRLLGRVLAIAAGQYLAHDDFVDFAFFDAGPFDRFLDHNGAQVRGANAGQRSVETPQRCSHRTDDDCFVRLLNSQHIAFIQRAFQGFQSFEGFFKGRK